MQSSFHLHNRISTITAINCIGPIIETWNRQEKNAITLHAMQDTNGDVVWPTLRPSIYHDLEVSYQHSAMATQFDINWKHVPTEEEILRLNTAFDAVAALKLETSLHP